MRKGKFNGKIVFLSILGLIFLALSYLISWWFILPVAIILWMNQKEILGK